MKRTLCVFLLVLLGVSLPFWAAGWLTTTIPLPVQLPVSALTFICPLVAAVYVTPKKHLKQLLAACHPFRYLPKRWWVISIAAMPVAVSASYMLGQATDVSLTPLWTVVPFLMLYLLAAYCEETGWTAYMSAKLLERRGAVWFVGIFVGVVWAAWHLLPFIQTGNSVSWVIGQTVWTILFRIGLVWAYERSDRSGSVTVWLHATYNTAFSLLPFYGSSYNPWLMCGVMMTIIGCIAGYERLKATPSNRHRA